jgi:hypothetical protein
MAVAMLLTVFAGFAPTFYLKRFFGTPALTTLVVAHGVVFTCWVLLFVTQTGLVAAGRVRTHRKLGVFGGVLAGVMVVLGTVTAITAAGLRRSPPGTDPLQFLTIPLGDMAVFAVLIVAALWLRKDKEAHKRLMLLASVTLMAAAVARWPGVMTGGPLLFFGLTDVFVLAGIAYDWISRRKIHPAYVWGGLLLAGSQPLRLMISGTEWWRRLAEWMAG